MDGECEFDECGLPDDDCSVDGDGGVGSFNDNGKGSMGPFSFRCRLAILEDGGIDRIGVGLMGLDLGLPNVRFSMGLSLTGAIAIRKLDPGSGDTASWWT